MVKARIFKFVNWFDISNCIDNFYKFKEIKNFWTIKFFLHDHSQNKSSKSPSPEQKLFELRNHPSLRPSNKFSARLTLKVSFLLWLEHLFLFEDAYQRELFGQLDAYNKNCFKKNLLIHIPFEPASKIIAYFSSFLIWKNVTMNAKIWMKQLDNDVSEKYITTETMNILDQKDFNFYQIKLSIKPAEKNYLENKISLI
ncbi:hypothetical protein BpHYR1_006650 [Brachionus plicatilis]|uniref:Uncharacterized protein n=1 Tax=Brachionus plicatilis TaxID=10195 RepID=A0A3M7R2R7_BRAPC|nr:hypothetical protein BpHYR1_006650 [Brachionus plicatilis]